MTEIIFRVWHRKEKKMYYRGYQKLTHVLLCDDDRGAHQEKGGAACQDGNDKFPRAWRDQGGPACQDGNDKFPRAWRDQGGPACQDGNDKFPRAWRDQGIPAKQASYEDCEFMQSAGLKDRRGLEIFEGDRVRVKWQNQIAEGILEEIPDMFKSRGLHPLHLLLAAAGIPDKAEGIEMEVTGNRYE